MNKSLFEETRRFILGRMREQLAAGNHKMQTEKELASEVLASYATVRLVMKELEQEGFIRRIQGSGPICNPRPEDFWRRLHGRGCGFSPPHCSENLISITPTG